HRSRHSFPTRRSSDLAKEIIDNYKKQFPNIQQYMDNTINFARECGYVETLMGRKRWLKDINSANFTVRGYAERNAINSPIQGTADRKSTRLNSSHVKI